MLIAIDGVDGVGKTTYATRLSEALGLRRVRSWEHAKRAAKEGKWEQWHQLMACGVEVNGPVEDLYSLDIIGVLGASAILDRTITSAIAYSDSVLIRERSDYLLNAWYLLVSRIEPPHLFVWLRSPWSTSSKRREGRDEKWGDIENKARYNRIQKRYAELFEEVRIPKIAIDTSRVSVESGTKRIIGRLRG